MTMFYVAELPPYFVEPLQVDEWLSSYRAEQDEQVSDDPLPRINMMMLYEFPASGSCHKVRLMLSLLGLQYQSVLVNASEREHKSPEFLRNNPFGQVPVLTDGDVTLRDSQAILVYLALQYGEGRWLPTAPAEISEVVAWLSTAGNEAARGPNALRLHYKFGRALDVPAAQEITSQLYGVLETRLQTQAWITLGRPTIADVALYPYVALSPEGHIDLQQYPAIRAWLGRIQALPGYVGMPGMIGSGKEQ